MYEEWRTVKEYENYEVSNFGRVRNRKNGYILKPYLTAKKYHKVWLYKDGKKKMFFIHRLVLMMFNPVEGMEDLQVNHKDENKTNNRLDNLEWCDNEYNMKYGTRMERIIATTIKNGKRRKPVEQYNFDGELIATYPSITEARNQTGINNIGLACNKKIRHAGGFVWKFVK